MRGTYDIVEMWMQVMAESLSLGIPCDGAKLSELFLNRTFNLETGPMFVDREGVHLLDLDIYSYDTRRGAMIVRGCSNKRS